MAFLIGMGVRKKKRQEKGRLDSAVAALMLQEYLDARQK